MFISLRFLLVGWLLLSSEVCFAQEPSKKIVRDFIGIVKSGNKEKLAWHVSYALYRGNLIPPIRNEKEFVERYSEIFDEKLVHEIVTSDPETDWSWVGYRGVMLNSGLVWLNEGGQLTAVNYQSPFEEHLWRKLLVIDKKSLHPSLRDYDSPVLIMETSSHRIRIDRLRDDVYRFASWKKGAPLSDSPLIILNNGEVHYEGSGGNHKFVFTNGSYRFDCWRWIIGGEKGSPDAELNIYKNNSQISSQPAVILRD